MRLSQYAWGVGMSSCQLRGMRMSSDGATSYAVCEPSDDRRQGLRRDAHVAAREQPNRLRAAVLDQQVYVRDRTLFVFLAVHEQERGARAVEDALFQQRQALEELDVLGVVARAEHARARLDQLHQIAVGKARIFDPVALI